MQEPPHRKRVKHPIQPGVARELTFSCYQRRPLLTQDSRHLKLLADAINTATRKQHFALTAFVFMPEHVHLLVQPTLPDASVSKLLFAIKRPHSYRVKQIMIHDAPALIDLLTVTERPGKTSFRFWQEGSGYDRGITAPEARNASIEYIHANPVRRSLCGLPGGWRWSSWHHYHGGRTEGLPAISWAE